MRRAATLLACSAFALVLAGSASAADTAAPAPAATPAFAATRTLEADQACTACHNESWPKPILGVYHAKHGQKGDPRTPGCQSCHGTSEKHRADPGGASPDVVFANKSKNVSAVDTRNGVCLTCHEGGKRNLWHGSQHQREDLACVSCHQVHNAGDDPVLTKAAQPQVCFTCHQTQRAETHRISTHPIDAGKVACSDCHNPHGSEGPKLVVEKTVRDTCFNCHAEKRGPFLYEHPPVADDCLNCHTPHGSTNAPLLVARQPWLCQECHGNGPPHPGNVYSGASLPGGAVANANTRNPVLAGTINRITGSSIAQNNPPPQMAFRGCTNCHSQIHGSNSPAGERFVR
ncbi:MAG TPA: DmsE family decaheme c-type cytochrome [Casimicrobiaceae bacterium]|nr:DmsE family decaheme c-type cytochrome [Casimicrobiaceae bacterium]